MQNMFVQLLHRSFCQVNSNSLAARTTPYTVELTREQRRR